MLTLIIPGEEYFNEETQEFWAGEETVLTLEHSLISLSKWEARFEKPFLGPQEKSSEELLGYIEAMILDENYDKDCLFRLSQENLEAVNTYINAAQTGTTFPKEREQRGRPRQQEIISSELIYYWMVALNIPFEAERWHLNRLFTLIKVCNVKSQKPKKMSQRELAEQRARLNEERRAQFNTSG
jgi:hypothetical protein